MSQWQLDRLSLAELKEVEEEIRVMRPKAIARDVARIEAEAIEAGFSLEDMLGKKEAARARKGG